MPLTAQVRELRAKIRSLGLAPWKPLMTSAKAVLVTRKMWKTEWRGSMTDKI